MTRAYDESYLDICQTKLASMFEIAFYHENLSVDDFASKFTSSFISKAFEEANPIYVLGKSANELLAIVLNKEPESTEQREVASPEYWLGWV